jgi:hypothetical protein
MDPQLNLIHSEARLHDLLEHAVRFDGPIRKWGGEVAVTVRAAGPGDAGALERLAALDERPLPPAPLLIGEVGCLALAALSLADNRVVADPFVPTREVVALLKLRARQLRPPGRGWRRIAGRRAPLLL